MLSFECDYSEGCMPQILDALVRTNMVQQPGYGADKYTLSAQEKIRAACQAPDAQVYFLNGGTQTNQIVIDTMLQPYEGVVAAATGHVAVHEAGAIEFSGHKVLTVPSHMGKVDAGEVDRLVDAFYANGSHEHMVFPGMVYISHPTEYGTLYTADELRALSVVCRERGLLLYMDGARLGYGLAARGTDVDLPLVAELCDAFYIGGTKVGALNGEALVFPRGNAPAHYLTRIKQHGALFAKGRLVGLQFDTLFTDGLYYRAGAHGVEMADRLKRILQAAGLQLYVDSPTNQQFAMVANEEAERLRKRVALDVWETCGNDAVVVRFATSWATTQESLDELELILGECLGLR